MIGKRWVRYSWPIEQISLVRVSCPKRTASMNHWIGYSLIRVYKPIVVTHWMLLEMFSKALWDRIWILCLPTPNLRNQTLSFRTVTARKLTFCDLIGIFVATIIILHILPSCLKVIQHHMAWVASGHGSAYTFESMASNDSRQVDSLDSLLALVEVLAPLCKHMKWQFNNLVQKGDKWQVGDHCHRHV